MLAACRYCMMKVSVPDIVSDSYDYGCTDLLHQSMFSLNECSSILVELDMGK